MGDLLVSQFFENSNFLPADSILLQNHTRYVFLPVKSTGGQFQSSYHAELESKFQNALFQFGYLTYFD